MIPVVLMDHELDKVFAWIDDRDAEAEQWLNEQAAERFNLKPEAEMAAYLAAVLSSDLLPD